MTGRPRTPSTFSIATAPYRAAVLAGLADPRIEAALLRLHDVGRVLIGREAAVSGLVVPEGLSQEVRQAASWLVRSAGPWIHPDRWDATTVANALADHAASDTAAVDVDVAEGRRAAKTLSDLIGRSPGTHLAVVLQDLDNMGRYLSGEAPARDGATVLSVDAENHKRVSAQLREVAERQVAAASDGPGATGDSLHGVPVYAGGDDLLLLAPAASALALAQRMHDEVPIDLPSASSAVFYFHQQSSLRQAISLAQELLHSAKELDGKHGLAVGYARRSGGSHQTVMPWVSADGGSAALFAALSRAGGSAGPISPRLVSDLQRDAVALASLLRGHQDLLRLELNRLVARHSGNNDPRSPATQALGDLLLAVGRRDALGRGHADGFDPVPVARVGVFLRQEAR